MIPGVLKSIQSNNITRTNAVLALLQTNTDKAKTMLLNSGIDGLKETYSFRTDVTPREILKILDPAAEQNFDNLSPAEKNICSSKTSRR